MSTLSRAVTWRVAEASFVATELRHPSERQMRLEFACGLRLVITESSQIRLAAALIETFRDGKESLR